jgi:hypothetical protein
MKTTSHALRLRQAVELLHRTDTRPMLMHTATGTNFTSCHVAAASTRAMP